ncbi:hypothetical protein PF001_g27299 [Phytophthora fragariae]|uniref:Uncharacterized protein n=1 Tax=Phytophthora fragariae TaxID=53985 RepID=A0A6A4BK13_9STRA|nr:hypothetical protein PF001_g27299 [Phytophthora fragariae]
MSKSNRSSGSSSACRVPDFVEERELTDSMATSAASWGRVTVGAGFAGGFGPVGIAAVSARAVLITVVCISLMMESLKALGSTSSAGFVTSVRVGAADSWMARGGRFMGMRLGDSRLLSESTLDWYRGRDEGVVVEVWAGPAEGLGASWPVAGLVAVVSLIQQGSSRALVRRESRATKT